MDWLMNFIASTDYLFLEFNWFTTIIIFIIIGVGIYTYKNKRDKDIITMIWIFWTFAWIIWGLYFFNVEDITWSIPKLIGWLKTAFYTSIFGLWITIILHLIEKQDESKDEIDFLKDIKNVIENWNLQNSFILEELKSLNKWIWWDWDNSLVNQIKLLKSDWNQNHKDLKNSFDAFADKMADNNIDALTEAIEKVMWEFNAIINEKLSKTFDDFKTSVENLNIWQLEYKQNIIDSTELLNRSKESLEISSKWFEIIVEKAEIFSSVSEKLWEELKSLNDSLKIFQNWINEFDWMSEKFDGVVKNTKEMAISMTESINSLTTNFVSKAETMIKDSWEQITMMKEVFAEQSKDLKESHKDILTDLKEEYIHILWNVKEENINIIKKVWEELEKESKIIFSNLSENINKIWEDIKNSSTNFSEVTKTMIKDSWEQITMMKEVFAEQSKDLKESHKDILTDLKQNVDNTNKNVSEQFERIWNELEKQVIKLDKELWDALSKSLSSLWQELTSITNKFTQQLADLNNVINNINK